VSAVPGVFLDHVHEHSSRPRSIYAMRKCFRLSTLRDGRSAKAREANFFAVTELSGWCEVVRASVASHPLT